jgi:hypothetical protein
MRDSVSSLLQDLLRRMLDKNPGTAPPRARPARRLIARRRAGSRITMDQILAHDWLTKCGMFPPIPAAELMMPRVSGCALCERRARAGRGTESCPNACRPAVNHRVRSVHFAAELTPRCVARGTAAPLSVRGRVHVQPAHSFRWASRDTAVRSP